MTQYKRKVMRKDGRLCVGVQIKAKNINQYGRQYKDFGIALVGDENRKPYVSKIEQEKKNTIR